MDLLVKDAKEQGVSSIVLEAMDIGRPLYEKYGFVKMVNYLKDNEEITTAKGVEITGKSEAQVRRYLKVLCNLEIIKSTRTTKGNIYVKI